MYRFSFILLMPIMLSSADLVIEEDTSQVQGAFKLFGSAEELLHNNYVLKVIDKFKEVFSIVTGKNEEKGLSKSVPEDAHLNIGELALKYGYILTEYEVQTEDDYILKIHRIHRKGIFKNINVFLMHGLVDSSDSWVIQGPGRALAYLLADEGYDVWLGNARGNKYSNKHAYLNTSDAQFWKFSWEEIGVYDLPAMIDYVLDYKYKESLYYIGHSQGTTSFYVMTSMKPSYNKKIKTMFAVSPVTYMLNAKSPILRMFSPANKFIAYWLANFNIYSPSVEYINKILSVLCSVIPRCDNLFYLIGGENHKFIDESLLPVIFSHMPSGASTLQFVHYGQLVESGRFCRYDFGEEVNSQIYQSTTPPDYELNQVSASVVLFYSGDDWLSDVADVKSLVARLPNVAATEYIDGYNHWDFMYAANAKDLVYSQIINRINKFHHFQHITLIKN